MITRESRHVTLMFGFVVSCRRVAVH